MEVLNLATSAFFEVLKNHNLDESLLVQGTGLTVSELKNTKGKHQWSQFVHMYANLEKHLGREKVARDVALSGLNNNNISFIKKIGLGLISVKNGYRFTCGFVAKHLYGNTVKFEYKALEFRKISIEISIHPSAKECPILFETYHRLFELTPSLIGFPKASVMSTITGHKAIYFITFTEVNYFFHFVSILKRLIEGNRTTIDLLCEIEDRKQELEKLNEEKAMLLRILSHDIANNASTIDLVLHVLNKKLTQDESMLGVVQKAQIASKRIAQVLRGVRILERRELELSEFSPISAREILQRLEINYRPMAEAKGMNLVVHNDIPNDAFIKADNDPLEVSVFGNLIHNAIKFSYPGSNITITGQLVDREIVFKVSDLGTGMSDEKKANLFNKKFQISSLGTSGEEGTGLGVGIVKSFIDVFMGRIEVFDNYPTGTVLILSFPVTDLRPSVSESLLN